MQLEIERSSQVAPMSDLCRQWQQNGSIEMDWYFELAEKFGTEKIVFNSVQIESPLFQRLKEKTLEHHLAPVYVVTVEQFCETQNIEQHLKDGVHYTVLIYSPLTTEITCLVEKLTPYLSQLSFVILARKDWNVRNCYRSIPHFMRPRLFVDFPVSIHESDPFYEPAELTTTRQKFEKDFLDQGVQSFCPNLGIYNEWGKKNISHFSRPRKLLKNKPKVSIVALDPDHLKPLLESKVLQKSPEDFEILITRVAGQKTKVIPKVKSVVTTRYWAHPIESDKPVSAKVLANFTASQADGDILVFLDPQLDPNLDGLFSVLLSGEVNFGKLMVRKNLFVFDKTSFFKVGGFDELLATWEGERVRIQDLLYPDLVGEEQQKNLGPVLEKVENSCDQLLLAHHFADRIGDFRFLKGKSPATREMIEQRQRVEEMRYQREDMKDNLRMIAKAKPSEILGGNLAIFLDFFLRGYTRHAWKFSPLRLRHLYRTHYWKYDPFRFLYHFVRKHAWRVSPLRMRHFYRKHFWKYNIFHFAYHWFKKHAWKVSPTRARYYLDPYLWRLNPWNYAWPHHVKWFILTLPQQIFIYIPQRIYGWWVRFYWTAFRLSFPFRKVYYFAHFQYEKRILGLHSKTIHKQEG